MLVYWFVGLLLCTNREKALKLKGTLGAWQSSALCLYLYSSSALHLHHTAELVMPNREALPKIVKDFA